jgi:topoisomerase IA-like protein
MRPSYLQACYLIIEAQEKIRQVYTKFGPWVAESQDAPLGSDLQRFRTALQKANDALDQALENAKDGEACECSAREATTHASHAETLAKELNAAAIRLIRAHRS